MATTDPAGSCLDPTGQFSGRMSPRWLPDGILMQGKANGYRLLTEPRRWLWWLFGSRVIRLTCTALQRSRETEHVQESDPTGQCRVGRRHGVSRWNFEARSTAPDS
ncbi:hypothetical protein CRG98_040583 [Punica granatum]|uniref:Uncharacterized protein n=1 Tax=Punica granatum TaxID=22663 RepID=A0A2I0I4Y3_PUNGR|nr:hypothetical protein CRG98_040583 [Punica granatum]